MKLSELKAICIEQKIPILRDKSLELLVRILKDNNYHSLLEIGSALGYTALYLASLGYHVVSIEQDEARYLECLKNQALINQENKVNFILGDARNYPLKEQFDVIFIDGAKGQYQLFFNNFINNLNSKGSIFIDNMAFMNNDLKRFKTITKRLKEFYNYLKNNYQTNYIDIDDGVCLVNKK